jgi:hypothetical protein
MQNQCGEEPRLVVQSIRRAPSFVFLSDQTPPPGRSIANFLVMCVNRGRSCRHELIDPRCCTGPTACPCLSATVVHAVLLDVGVLLLNLRIRTWVVQGLTVQASNSTVASIWRSIYGSWCNRRYLSNGEVQIIAFWELWSGRSDRVGPLIRSPYLIFPILGVNRFIRAASTTARAGCHASSGTSGRLPCLFHACGYAGLPIPSLLGSSSMLWNLRTMLAICRYSRFFSLAIVSSDY